MQQKNKSNSLNITLVILLGLGLVFVLYRFGNTKGVKKEVTTKISKENIFSEYERIQLERIPLEDADRIRTHLSDLTLNPNLENTLTLSNSWEAIGNYPLGAYYYYKATELDSDSLSWITAGDKLYNSYKNYADTLVTDNLLTFALASYETALEKDKSNVVTRMKLAEAYVDSPQPMEGITMMREILDSIPEYTPALMTLGRLSLQTGQYDKAVNRFSKILETNPVNTEAMYFLALAHEGLGNVEECIKLLEACKALVNIPEFTQEINEFIKELENK